MGVSLESNTTATAATAAHADAVVEAKKLGGQLKDCESESRRWADLMSETDDDDRSLFGEEDEGSESDEQEEIGSREALPRKDTDKTLRVAHEEKEAQDVAVSQSVSATKSLVASRGKEQWSQGQQPSRGQAKQQNGWHKDSWDCSSEAKKAPARQRQRWQGHEWYGASWQDSWQVCQWKAKDDQAACQATTEKPKCRPKRSPKLRGVEAKHQSQVDVGIEEEPVFRVMRRILGPGGQNMKLIADKTGARLRLRGKGSRFLEGPEQKESRDPLMLCISAPGAAAADEARVCVSAVLEQVYAEFRDFCREAGWPAPHLRIRFHDGARIGSR